MLSVDDLCKPILERAKTNHETYKLVYTQCVDHIKRKHEAGCTITLYQVPDFVLGRPLFTHAHAIRYIAEKLRRGKFDVQVDGPVLHIDWEARIKEACRKKVKRPRPLVPPPPPPPAKKRTPAKKKTPPPKKKAPPPGEEPLSIRLKRLLG